MDEEKQYIDADGNKRSLIWMVRHEPEWAANVIKHLKHITQELIELMERSDREEFDENCQPVTSEEWFSAISHAKKYIGG